MARSLPAHVLKSRTPCPPLIQVLRQLQADLDDLGGVFDAAQAGALLDDERLEHAQIVTRLKKELAVQAATSARLRASLEQRCDVMQVGPVVGWPLWGCLPMGLQMRHWHCLQSVCLSQHGWHSYPAA